MEEVFNILWNIHIIKKEWLSWYTQITRINKGRGLMLSKRGQTEKGLNFLLCLQIRKQAKSDQWWIIVGLAKSLAKGPRWRVLSFRMRLDPTDSGRHTKLPWPVPRYLLFPTDLPFNPEKSQEKEQLIIFLSQGMPGGENGCWFGPSRQPVCEGQGDSLFPKFSSAGPAEGRR